MQLKDSTFVGDDASQIFQYQNGAIKSNSNTDRVNADFNTKTVQLKAILKIIATTLPKFQYQNGAIKSRGRKGTNER